MAGTPGDSHSRFSFVFPSAAALGSRLVIICLWEWEVDILDPTHILNFK